MTKKDYLNSLRNELPKNNANYVEDIIDELEMHFEEAYKEGMTDEEIIDRLGSVHELVGNIKAMQPERAHESKDVDDDFDEGSHGIVTGEIDTIVINGNLDVEIVPGTIPGLVQWDFDPGWTFEIQKLFQRKNPIGRSNTDINVEQVGKTLRFSLDITKGSGGLSLLIPIEIRHIFVDTLSGNIDISDVELSELEINTVSDDCSIDNSVIDNLRIKCTSGDVDLSGVSGTVDISATSGDVNIVRHQGMRIICESISGDIRADTTAMDAAFISKSGDVDMTLLGDVTYAEGRTISGDIEMRIASADVTCEADLLSGDIENRTDMPTYRKEKRKWIIGEGNGKVLLSTTSGDIVIKSA